MQTIPEQYVRNGYTFRLVKRDGAYAIYQQAAYTRSWFELVHVRTRKERVLPQGGVIQAGEFLPSDNEWGRHGWTYQTLAEAEAAMAERLTKTPISSAN